MPTVFLPSPIQKKKELGQGTSLHVFGGGSEEYRASAVAEATQQRIQQQRARATGAQQGPQGSPIILPPLDKNASAVPTVTPGSGGGIVLGGGGSGSGGSGGGGNGSNLGHLGGFRALP